ncbi:hypothetical protein CDEST_09976 [Colletotrichum destructivum]|uniref:Uncharacterized protein n=1 Tax=Colletotrichum destructivum TaxID=34406 RepID=A0AAX4IP01_9PEZI|nr:hypothetical protein CDEST_09976 [Colletotrichum destructivum]
MPIELYNNSCVNDGMSWIYYDNIEYLPNTSNAFKMGWADVQPAFKKPTHTGHGNAHLRIANNIPFPESVDHGVFTELAAITYNFPESMMEGGTPKAMDPAWNIC